MEALQWRKGFEEVEGVRARHGEVVSDVGVDGVCGNDCCGPMSNLALGVEVGERFRASPAQRAPGVSALAASPVAGPHAGREGIEDHAEAMVSKLVGGLLWKAAKIRQDGFGKILGRVGVGLPSRAQLLPESGEAVVGCFLETPKDVVALGILGGEDPCMSSQRQGPP